ncbi:hypothetical protein AZE42_09803 [Rhizopogon vesiculosus]|uniref:Uncharacterized protein n=1 Tax=Rhizopogon vesiculosus TaxID=180088 RepID=A0A1J8QND4_9AGAM|nr:hypothetical protein AZE42_09803 [Rhizopogon vesiculosus]
MPMAPELPSGSGSSSVQAIQCMEPSTSKNTKKRKKKPTVNIYTPKSSTVPQLHQHTQYQANDTGSITYTRKYVAPPKNARIPQLSPGQSAWIIEDLPFPPIPEPFDDFPPEVSIDSEYLASRKRTAGCNTHSKVGPSSINVVERLSSLFSRDVTSRRKR